MRSLCAMLKTMVVLVAAMLVTSCASPQKSITSIPSPPPSVTSTPEGAQKEIEQPAYRLISSADGIIYNGGAQVADGFYELIFTKDVLSGAKNIVYTDFSSLHRIYLSSDINSDHQSESDTSFVPASVGGAAILTDGQYIYIIKKGSLLLQDSYGEVAKPCIYRADLDGSNRVEIDLSFDEAVNSTSGVFSNGDTLLFLIDVVDKDATGHQELVCADFSAKSITPLIDFSEANLGSQNLALVGSFGDKLVISVLQISESGDITKDLYTLDPLRGTISPLTSFSDKEQYAFFQHGNIYYIDLDENSLYQFDPNSAESELVIASVVPPDLNFDSMQIGFAAPEPYFVFRFTSGDNSFNYYWNCDTKEWKQELLKDGEREVHIYGVWKDYFLVMLQDKMVSYQDFTEDGQSFTNQMAVTEYALISQNDYWNGIPNYIRFTDDVYGS